MHVIHYNAYCIQHRKKLLDGCFPPSLVLSIIVVVTSSLLMSVINSITILERSEIGLSAVVERTGSHPEGAQFEPRTLEKPFSFNRLVIPDNC